MRISKDPKPGDLVFVCIYNHLVPAIFKKITKVSIQYHQLYPNLPPNEQWFIKKIKDGKKLRISFINRNMEQACLVIPDIENITDKIRHCYDYSLPILQNSGNI